MGQGDARLTVTIAGKDDASREIGKVAVSAEKLQQSLNKASERGNQLTGWLRSIASGDVRGGLGGVAKLLGPGTGMAGAATMAAAGIAGVAAAVGVAALKMTEWSIEIERLRAQMRFAFDGGEKEAFALADAIGGVAVESVVKLKSTLKAADVNASLTAEQLQKITNAATAMGKTGDDALNAFADAIRSGSADALKQVGVLVNGEVAIKKYAKAIGVSSERLSANQRSQAVLNAVMEKLPSLAQAGTDAYARQDSALSTLGNSTKRLALELSEVVAGPAVEIVESMNKIGASMDNAAVSVKTALRVMASPITAVLRSVNEALKAVASLAAGADKVFAAIKMRDPRQIMGALAAAQTEVGNAAEHAAKSLALGIPGVGAAIVSYEALTDATSDTATATEAATKAMQTQSASVGGVAYALDLYAQNVQKATDAQIGFAKAEEAATARRRQAAAAAAKHAAAEAKRAFADFEAGIDALLTRGGEALDRNIEARAAAVQALQDRVLGVAFDTAATPEARAAAAQAQIQARMVAELERVKGDEYLRTAEKAQLSAAIQAEAQHQIMRAQADLADAQRRSAEEAIRLEEEQRAARLQTVDAYGSAAKTLAGVLFEADTAKRVSAGIDAAIETARSIAAFASYDIAGGIGHAAAAAAFAKVALTSAPTPAAAATAGPQRAPLQQTAQTASTGGGPLVVNITGGLGTPAEVGAAIRKAMRAVAGTGMGGAAAYGGA